MESCGLYCKALASFLWRGSPRFRTNGALLVTPGELHPDVLGEDLVTSFWRSWEPGPRTRTVSSELERALAEQELRG